MPRLTTPPVFGPSIASALVLAFVALCGSAARGDIYQPFNASATIPVSPGSLVDPTGTLATNGNHLRETDILSYDAGPLDTWGTPGTDMWVSWLQRRDRNNLGFQGFVVLDPQPDGHTRFGVYFVGEPGGGPGENTLVIGRAGDDANVVSSGVPLVPNQTYFLVAHFQFRDGNDLATLFVNPTPGGAEPTGGVTYSGLDMPVVRPFVELLGAANSGSGVVQEFDELRIGSTYAAVAPVPEPGAFAAVGFLLLVGCSRRLTRRFANRG